MLNLKQLGNFSRFKMRNIEYKASVIVFDLIMYNRTYIITHKPLADMVEKMLKVVLEEAKVYIGKKE